MSSGIKATEFLDKPQPGYEQVTGTRILEVGGKKFALDVYVKGLDGEFNVSSNEAIELADGETVVDEFYQITDKERYVWHEIGTYTVPLSKTFYLMDIECSGGNMAHFRVSINNVVKRLRRTSLTEFNTVFNYASGFMGRDYAAGTEIKIEAMHFKIQNSDFNTTVFGVIK